MSEEADNLYRAARNLLGDGMICRRVIGGRRVGCMEDEEPLCSACALQYHADKYAEDQAGPPMTPHVDHVSLVDNEPDDRFPRHGLANSEHYRCCETHAAYGRCAALTGHEGEHRAEPNNRMTAWS